MSTNKHAIIRYQTLDKYFRNLGRNYAIKDLVEECNKSIYEYTGKEEGIKKRQLYDDIRFMESEQGWNIELKKVKDGRTVFYKYENSNFSISNQPLNETEANQLREALLTLERFKGLPQYNWINEINARLESTFNLKQKNDVIISFEQNEYLKGLEFIPMLYNAILYKKVLSINYKSFNSDEEIAITVSPYYLKQYNMRWFLFAKSKDYESISNLALDRIETIKENNQEYIETDIDFNEYFKDVVGVTIPSDKTENIVLRIDKSLISYIKTKPLHGSQKIKESGYNFEVHLKLIPNYELETLILSFGEKTHESIGGIYRRYSDDMVEICPLDKKDDVIKEFAYQINNSCLTIQNKKTQIFHFEREVGTLKCGQEFPNGINYNKNFIYLGLEFDGVDAKIKSASISGYYRKMKRTIRRGKYFSRKPLNKYSGELFKARLLKRISYKGADRRNKYIWNASKSYFEITQHFDWGNFISYAKKAQKIKFPNKVKSQTKRHWNKLEKQLKL